MTVCWWAGLYFPHMHWSQNRRWGNRPFLSHNPFLYEDPPCESMGGCGGIMATAALLHTRSRAYTHIHTHTHGTVPTCCGQGVLALSRFSSSIHRIIHSPTAPPPPELYPSLVPSISFCASSFTSSSFSLYPSIPATSHQSVSVQDPWQTVPITAAAASSSFSSSSSTSSFSLLLFFSSSDAAAPADALTLPPWSRAAAAASHHHHHVTVTGTDTGTVTARRYRYRLSLSRSWWFAFITQAHRHRRGAQNQDCSSCPLLFPTPLL